MSFSSSLKVLAFLSLCSHAAAHIVMAHPQPFTAEYMATSPLSSDGSNFPCQYKDASSYDFAVMNNLAVGQDIPLSFNGSASHGGGTCQLAVSLDTAPTKSSVWKNIMVFEGGCPISATGNDGTSTFSFQIPANFPNGRATLGWVWNNRIGNREIYMSCAPITVSGGASDSSYYNTLPDLYVVNLPPSECTIAEGKNLIIPNPGQFVVTASNAPGGFASATGSGCAAATGVGGGGNSPSPSVSYASSLPAATSNPVATYSSTNSVTVSAPGTAPTANPNNQPTGYGVATKKPSASTDAGQPTFDSAPTQVPNSDNLPTTTTTATTTIPTVVSIIPVPISTSGAAAASTSIPSATSASSPSPTSAANDGSVCNGSNDGALVCNGVSQFGLCDHGGVVWQAVAEGTTCTNGQILKKRNFAAIHHPHWAGGKFLAFPKW